MVINKCDTINNHFRTYETTCKWHDKKDRWKPSIRLQQHENIFLAITYAEDENNESGQFRTQSKVNDFRSESKKNWSCKFKTLKPKHITSTGGRCSSSLISQRNWGRIGRWHKSRSKVQIPTKVSQRYPVQWRMFLWWIRTLSVRHFEDGHVRTMWWDRGLEKKPQP